MTHSLTYLLTRSLTHSLTQSHTYLLTHSKAYIPPDRSDDDEGHGNVLQSARDTVMSITPSDDEVGGVMGMTLDAAALQNLEILVNNFDKTEKGSLWTFVNRCKTAFGKRILKVTFTRSLTYSLTHSLTYLLTLSLFCRNGWCIHCFDHVI